jgi:hypothetical protein
MIDSKYEIKTPILSFREQAIYKNWPLIQWLSRISPKTSLRSGLSNSLFHQLGIRGRFNHLQRARAYQLAQAAVGIAFNCIKSFSCISSYWHEDSSDQG